MMYSGDPRYDAANYAADAGAGLMRDPFYTGAVNTNSIQYLLQTDVPVEIGGPNPFGAYIVNGSFNPFGPVLRTPGEARGIVPTAPTQILPGSTSGGSTSGGSTSGGSSAEGFSASQLLVAALVALVAVKIVFD